MEVSTIFILKIYANEQKPKIINIKYQKKKEVGSKDK
jgi:hypothetical protein